MPIIQFRTNLPEEEVTREFHIKLSDKLAEALGKPKEFVSLTVECGLRMSRGGSFEPLCELYITSLHFNTTAHTLLPTRVITNFITTHTPIHANRVVVSFYSPDPCMVGFGGETKGEGRADALLSKATNTMMN